MEILTIQALASSRMLREMHQGLASLHLETAVFRVLCGNEGGTLLVGGDGRCGTRHAIDVISLVAAAQGMSRLITTTGVILSTPAASTLIRDVAELEVLRQPARCRPHHPLHWMRACLGDLIRATDALVKIRSRTSMDCPTFPTCFSCHRQHHPRLETFC
jgi:hypothetical protein